MNSIDFVKTYSAIILKSKKDAVSKEKYYSVSLVKRNTDVHAESEIKPFKTFGNSPMLSYYFAVIFETFFSVYLPSIYDNKLDAGRIIETFTQAEGMIKGYTINHLHGLQNVLDLFLIVNVHLHFVYNKNGVILYTIA